MSTIKDDRMDLYKSMNEATIEEDARRGHELLPLILYNIQLLSVYRSISEKQRQDCLRMVCNASRLIFKSAHYQENDIVRMMLGVMVDTHESYRFHSTVDDTHSTSGIELSACAVAGALTSTMWNSSLAYAKDTALEIEQNITYLCKMLNKKNTFRVVLEGDDGKSVRIKNDDSDTVL